VNAPATRPASPQPITPANSAVESVLNSHCAPSSTASALSGRSSICGTARIPIAHSNTSTHSITKPWRRSAPLGASSAPMLKASSQKTYVCHAAQLR
jgi:hypothetical protein